MREVKERQRSLEEDKGDHGKSRDRAFKRDDHTCQVCKYEGIPKAERGLIAYPVQVENHHLDNLVTICDNCITETLNSNEDEQTTADQLRMRATRAKKWINHGTESPEYLNEKDS